MTATQSLLDDQVLTLNSQAVSIAMQYDKLSKKVQQTHSTLADHSIIMTQMQHMLTLIASQFPNLQPALEFITISIQQTTLTSTCLQQAAVKKSTSSVLLKDDNMQTE